MATHWEVIQSGAPPAKYEFTGSGWLWHMEIGQLKHGKIALVDGAGLVVTSNNPGVIPNDELVFKGKMGSGPRRIIEFYGLSDGTSMIEGRKSEDASLEISLQVHVKELPGSRASFIALDSPSVALNSEDTPVFYQMDKPIKIKKGEKVQDIIKKVPKGTKHLAISCHGQPRGILEIGEGFNKTNVNEFSALKDTKLLVIWIGGCSVAGTPEGTEFCKQIARNAFCHVVAPGITLPFVKPPAKCVELFKGSLPKYINQKGDLIPWGDFFKKHKELDFKVV